MTSGGQKISLRGKTTEEKLDIVVSKISLLDQVADDTKNIRQDLNNMQKKVETLENRMDRLEDICGGGRAFPPELSVVITNIPHNANENILQVEV